MAKKRNNDFSSQRDILNFRPVINFIEPDQVEEEFTRELPPTINSIKSATDQLKNDYKNIEELSNVAQERIDSRAKNLVIKLDSTVDSHIIDAVRRHFNDPRKTHITYDDYKECLSHINDQANFSTIDLSEITNGSQDPFRTNFGVFGADSGRPELQGNTQSVAPIDLNNFQIEQLEKLLELLTPGIQTISIKIAKELLTKL